MAFILARPQRYCLDHIVYQEASSRSMIARQSMTALVACHSGSVRSAAFSRDGQKIVSASMDESVRVWSAVTGECEQTLAGHSGEVNSAAFSRDGQKIVSARSYLRSKMPQAKEPAEKNVFSAGRRRRSCAVAWVRRRACRDLVARSQRRSGKARVYVWGQRCGDAVFARHTRRRVC
jgi:hypothetical protein